MLVSMESSGWSDRSGDNGAGCKRERERMEWLIWILLLLGAPFAFGLLWGVWRGNRTYFSSSVLALAPIFSGVSTVVGWLAVAFLAGEQVVNPHIPAWQSLMITCGFYGGIVMLIGALPALLGSAAGQWGKIWAVHRYQSVRQTEREERQK